MKYNYILPKPTIYERIRNLWATGEGDPIPTNQEKLVNIDIQQYNQGFGGFGPLEQCNDGKLMLSAEVIPVVKGLVYANGNLTTKLKEANEDVGRFQDLYDDTYDELVEARRTINRRQMWMPILTTLSIFGIGMYILNRYLIGTL